MIALVYVAVLIAMITFSILDFQADRYLEHPPAETNGWDLLAAITFVGWLVLSIAIIVRYW